MKCSEVQRALPEWLDGVPGAVGQNGFDAHLESCPACADLASDLKQITSASRDLAASEEPSPEVWLRIAAQLRSEGIIREPEDAPVRRPVLVPAARVRRPWSAWWLAPVAAALLVAGSYVVNHKPAPQVANQVPAPAAANPPVVATTSPNAAPASGPAPEQMAQTSPKPVIASKSAPESAVESPAESSTEAAANTEPELEPSMEPSTEDRQFLSVVSTRVPSMRAAYENQLQAVNADIREVQSYLRQNPGDLEARQHLMDAYQQKALLYQLALDRIQ